MKERANRLYELRKHRNLTQAIVIVTHNPEIAARCERTIEISDGVLVKAIPHNYCHAVEQ